MCSEPLKVRDTQRYRDRLCPQWASLCYLASLRVVDAYLMKDVTRSDSFEGKLSHYYPACACMSRAYMIGAGVHIYICLWTKKIFESYFSDRLTFSNISSRTSHRIYRLALPLHAPERLS